MQVKSNIVIALVVMVALSAGAVMAQTTTEVRQGKVLHVSGNQLLVELTDGSTKLFEVPADFRFDVDGRSLTVDQLKPGTLLTQTVTTTVVPEVVKTTEVREAEIVQRKGQTVIYRDARTDKLHMITGIPEGWIVFRNGKQVPIEALAGGDRVTAYIVHKETKMMTDEETATARSERGRPRGRRPHPSRHPRDRWRRCCPRPAAICR